MDRKHPHPFALRGAEMRYGISLNSLLGLSPTVEDVRRFAVQAEGLGFHSIVVGDHVLIPEFDFSTYPAGFFDPGMPWYDPFVVLAAIAGVTKTIRLVTGVAV